jgi:formylglycine-generating enzyme required for sulfatase activity
VGTAYSQTLTATGDTPITWTIDSGTLPAGLSLTGAVISGTLTTAGTSTFTVKATNAAGNNTKQFSIIIITPIEMIRIQGRTFTMGSPENEPERGSDETQHQVTLTGFYMGKYPVTQVQYAAVMGSNPSNFKTPVSPETSTTNRPVENVSWYDTIVFCNKLSMQEGLYPAYEMQTNADTNVWSTDPATWGMVPTGNNTRWNAVRTKTGSTGYRLPTEAQWEYACRAGTTTPFNTGNNITTDQANYNGNYPYNNNPQGVYLGRTTGVESYAANTWGLYDMPGNVMEWCWDWYDENYGGAAGEATADPTGAVSGVHHVLRGGSWNATGHYLRSAFRNRGDTSRFSSVGFRLVLENAVVATSVTLDKATIRRGVGGTETLTATVTPDDARNQNVKWTSSNAAIATVTDGTVTAVAVGSATITVTTVDGNHTATCTVNVITINEEDFGIGATINEIFNVANTTQWDTAVSTINSSNNGTSSINKNYIINVTADFSVADGSNATFNPRYIKISLRGAGRTLTLSSSGYLIRITSNQTVILRDLTLQGFSGNWGSVVYVTQTSAFVMQSGTISGNTNSDDGGGGVNVWGTFTMYGGTISGNTRSDFGGGVCLSQGTFDMYGGTISGNTASYGGGVYTSGNTTGGIGTVFTMHGGVISSNTASYGGGGVYNGRTFRIVTGTIYGNTEADTSLGNTASTSGAALLGTAAQRGTFSGEDWNSSGNLAATNDTIRVVNGVIVP